MSEALRIAIGPSSFATQNPKPMNMLVEAGMVIVPNPYGRRLTEAETMTQLEGVDGLVAGLEPLNRRVLATARRLKAIARVGIGMNNVDMEAVKELGIKISNTPEGPTEAVAEMTISALLALSRGIVSASNALHNKLWEKKIGVGLKDTKVLLVGYGRIGRRVSELLRAFGAKILVVDPMLSADALIEGEQLVTLAEGLRQAEVITLHASGTAQILGEGEFAQMQDGAILLNSARGELVDEDALVQALESGKVGGAWFDVFWKEPYQGRLCQFDQVLLTPHISTYTKQCRLEMEVTAVNNLLRDLEYQT